MRLLQLPGGTPATSTASVVIVCYNELGTFAATLTVSNASGTDTSTNARAVVVEVCTGISTPDDGSAFSVWPNPANGVLSVHWNEHAPARATFLSTDGRSLNRVLLLPGRNAVEVD